ncbi:hypothetical protein CR513_45680, partial [Mucuna pruriens]
MAYVRLAPLALFLLATSCIHVYICSNFVISFLVMFTPKKINAEGCGSICSPSADNPCSSSECSCVPHPFLRIFYCADPSEVASSAKMVDKHPSLCQSHDECIKKGNGNFCARYPNPGMDYGLCVNSETLKGFLKMPTATTE